MCKECVSTYNRAYRAKRQRRAAEAKEPDAYLDGVGVDTADLLNHPDIGPHLKQIRKERTDAIRTKKQQLRRERERDEEDRWAEDCIRRIDGEER